MSETDTEKILEKLYEKSLAGKIAWQATADERTYIATVAGNTFKVTTYQDEYQNTLPVLMFLNEDGKVIWRIDGIHNHLQEIYDLAQRIGDKVDDKIAAALESLEAL